MQEVSGVYTAPFLDAGGFSLRAWIVSGAFEKRAPGHESECALKVYFIHRQLQFIGGIHSECSPFWISSTLLGFLSSQFQK